MEIKVMDKRTGRTWIENFRSPFLMDKRINKLKHSKNLLVISVTRFGGM